jgi:hypothetical protein
MQTAQLLLLALTATLAACASNPPANRSQRLRNSGVKRLTQRMIIVCASDSPRSAIISTRSRKLSLSRRYQRTHRTMTCSSDLYRSRFYRKDNLSNGQFDS